MNRYVRLASVFSLVLLASFRAHALSIERPVPEIFFPKDYDTNQAARIHHVLQDKTFKYLGGLTSFWEPEFGTTLVYEGDSASLNEFLRALHTIHGFTVRVTFSPDLSRETGSALGAGSWWVKYSHTAPNTITVRINLASPMLPSETFALQLPNG